MNRLKKIVSITWIILFVANCFFAIRKVKNGEVCGDNRVISLVLMMICIFAVCLYKRFKTGKYLWILLVIVSFLFSNINIIYRDIDFGGYGASWDYGDFSPDIISMYANNGYETSNYPPLAVIIYRIANSLMISGKTDPDQAYMYALGCFLLFSSIIFIISANKIMSGCSIKETHRSIILIALFMTGPYLFAFERANVALLAFSLTMLFIALKDSDSKIEQYISYLSLVLAANIKLYPAVFGLLLVKKGKIKECIFTLIAGIMVFFLPFFLQAGWKVSDVIFLIRGYINSTREWIINSRELYNISQSLQRLFDESHVIADHSSIKYIFIVMFVIISIVGVFITKDEERKCILLFGLCFYIPTISLWYSVVFLLIPFILFITKYDKDLSYTYYIKMMLYISLITFIWGLNKLSFLYPHASPWRFILLWIWNYLEIIDEKHSFFEKIGKEIICLKEKAKLKLAK